MSFKASKRLVKKVISTGIVATTLSFSLIGNSLAHDYGLQLYSMRNHMEADLPKAMEQINSWGISLVEGGGNLYGRSVNGFKAILDEHQIDIVSVDTNYEEVRDNPMAAVYKAQSFGAKYATVYWIPHEAGKPFTFEHAKEAVEVFNKAGRVLRQNGITLQYHPHGYEFAPLGDGTILDYMLENIVDAQFQMDVFWIKQGGGDPLAILKKYEGKFTSLHLKDRLEGTPNTSDGSGDKESNVVLGTGDVGIAALVKEAKSQGIIYYFIEDESSRVLKQVPKSLAFLKSLQD